MRSAERQLVHYPMSLQVPLGPSSEECYSQERAIPGGQGRLLAEAQGQTKLPVPAATWPQTPHQGPAQPKGLSLVEEQSRSCCFKPGGSKLWGTRFAPLPAPSEHLPVVLARGWGAEEKLLSWLLAKHYTERVFHILAVSILGSQMTSLPDDTP